jgi:hypothetical protein
VGLCCGCLMDTNTAPLELPAAAESGHTSSHKSARIPRIEVITRGERRRRWTTEQKQTIAAQSLAPGASPHGGGAAVWHQQRATLYVAAGAAGGAAWGGRAYERLFAR